MNYFKKKGSKYSNIITMVDGIKFHSKAEAKRYSELKLLEKAKAITNLKLQPRYTLQEKFTKNGTNYRKIEYIGDFEYIENGITIIEDVKSLATAQDKYFGLKKKMLLKIIGDNIIFRENIYQKGIVNDY